jgi:HSP20 family protein
MRTLTPYWAPRTLPTDLFDEVDRVFKDAGLSAPLQLAYDERSFHPACDITESDEQFVIHVDMPGIKKEDIKVELSGDTLTISGERKREMAADNNEKVQRFERSYGFFKRSFKLPGIIDGNKVDARHENGVLELRLPKTTAAKPRQIEIVSGK